MQTNRPYSLLNVFENLHRAVAKPALTKILDNLCDAYDAAVRLHFVLAMSLSHASAPTFDVIAAGRS